MEKDDKRKEYEAYFNEILEELQKEFDKSNSYSQKIDEELQKFEGSMPSKGTQYFLIEHIKNAISLQSQRQSLIKDKFNIKKAVLDYVMKDKNEETTGKSLFDELAKIVKNDKDKIAAIGSKIESTIQKQQQEDIDSKIDEILENSDED
jgi:hypothetical protein